MGTPEPCAPHPDPPPRRRCPGRLCGRSPRILAPLPSAESRSSAPSLPRRRSFQKLPARLTLAAGRAVAAGPWAEGRTRGPCAWGSSGRRPGPSPRVCPGIAGEGGRGLLVAPRGDVLFAPSAGPFVSVTHTGASESPSSLRPIPTLSQIPFPASPTPRKCGTCCLLFLGHHPGPAPQTEWPVSSLAPVLIRTWATVLASHPGPLRLLCASPSNPRWSNFISCHPHNRPSVTGVTILLPQPQTDDTNFCSA